MSGTSLDGVDCVHCRVSWRKGSDVSIKYIEHRSAEFPKNLRERLLAAAEHRLRVDELALLHHELGRFYAELLQGSLRRKPLSGRARVDLIGLHGQTVFHQTPNATFQIGEPAYLAEVLGVSVVSQFRVADLAAGGEAAPLAPLFHQRAFEAAAKSAAVGVLNLGGIANITYLPQASASSRARGPTAFDTGPANMLVDLAVQKASQGRQTYDRDGAQAARGKVHSFLVEKWLAEAYFHKAPPKSCGREQFGEAYLAKLEADFAAAKIERLEDRLATLTDLSAASVARAVNNFLPESVGKLILCGGGASNLFLRQRLALHLPDCAISTSADFGWPSSAVEGGAFAYFAACHYWGLALTSQPFTGARHPVVLGQMARAQHYK